MTKRGGLGRGLAALIPTTPPPAPAPLSAPAPATSAEAGSAPAPPSGNGSAAAPASGNGAAAAPVPAATAEAAPTQPAPEQAPAAAPQPAGDGAVGVPGAQLREVAVEDVVPNPRQPRQVFDDEALEELTHSVREFGLLQPIVVRERADGGYELIMGERRLRAARAAQLETVPAIVRDTTDDALLRDALLENIHRVQLNPLEEAAAYQQLLEEFGATH
ncbi:MAG TPA: ParB/RepB/Spo0J family partition protein, partial [Geodermatophilus sp.]|nr:ParB/RepB/Spo0J family partition protein [Geodermatophilus sp.]